MDKVAGLAANERQDLFAQTAANRGINPAIIEKDFWVCWVLKKLFASKLSGDLVFKGGTSLSKAHHLIERFSEDIDLVLNWALLGYGHDGADPWKKQASNRKQDKFNKELNKQAQGYIRGKLCPQISELLASATEVKAVVSETEFQVIDIHYPAAFELDAIRPQVKLEIGPLASWVPSSKHTIRPYAADEFPAVFEDPDCPVVAITAERTFWEKATILHQQVYRTTQMPAGYSRHYYDLFHLGNSSVKANAFGDLELLKDVVRFKQQFYLCPWANYEEAFPGTFRLVPRDEINKQLASDYTAMQAMIFGTAPDWDKIINQMSELESEINGLPTAQPEE